MTRPAEGAGALSAERFGHRLAAELTPYVREHRFTIAVVFPLVGAATLLASDAGVLPPLLSYNPLFVLLGTLVMRTPLAAALGPLLDRRALTALCGVAGYAYAIELVGLRTDWPYGEFHYVADVGPMVAGVPVGLPLFFLPLALNAYLLAVVVGDALGERSIDSGVRRGSLARLGGPIARVALATALLVGIDLVLDPGAVAIRFWTYPDGGVYYGVPLSNVAGWVLSGAVATGLLEIGLDVTAVRQQLAACPFALDDLVSFTLLWGAVNFVAGHWIPVALTIALVLALARLGRFDVVAPRWLPGGTG